jgi:hypothetical protein
MSFSHLSPQTWAPAFYASDETKADAGFALFSVAEDLQILLDRTRAEWSELAIEEIDPFAARLIRLYVEIRLTLGTPAHRICRDWRPKHDYSPECNALRAMIQRGEEPPPAAWLGAYRRLIAGDVA